MGKKKREKKALESDGDKRRSKKNVKRRREQKRLKIKLGRSERRAHHKGTHVLWVKRVVTK